MAARVLLLGILFTEVLKPACAAGVDEGVRVKDVAKSNGYDTRSVKNSDLILEIEPGGDVILGRRAVTLHCMTGPNQVVTWLRNGKHVPPCDPVQCVLLPNGSLHFIKQKIQIVQKFKKEDGNYKGISRDHTKDEYRCISETDTGGSLLSSPTFVQTAELAYVFEKSPKDTIAFEGEVVQLSCHIDSVPFPPNITWQHNGKTVLLSHNSSKYITISPGVLYIMATSTSDAGLYKCIATNEFLKKTKKSKEAKLTIITKPFDNKSQVLPSLYPQISYNYLLINGSNLDLVCAVSGYPPPLISWTFVSRYSGNHSEPLILLNSTNGIAVLSLKNVAISNAGFYLCSMKNLVTNNLEFQNITVDVSVPPVFLKKPESQICPNGLTARFECQADGFPVPQIYWVKDSLNITTNGRRTTYMKDFNKIELAISATVPSDSGIYQCIAVNSAGEIWAAGRLQVNTSRNSPAAPTSLYCKAESPVKIVVFWKPPKSQQHTSITAYTVHYSPLEGGKEEVTPPEPGNSTLAEITKHLEPYTNYSIYVRVWNNHGASDQSAVIVCATASSVPKSSPKVNVNIISSTKLNISWEPLSKKEARGVIIEYKLQLRLYQHFSIRVICLNASRLNYLLTDLIPGAQYDIRVLARNELGYPTLSETQLEWVTVTMPSAESDQSMIKNVVDIEFLVVNSSVIKVKWKADLNHERDQFKFDSWQIYCENQNGQKLSTSFLPRNITEYSFVDLEANISYTMGLCMVNLGEATGCLTKHLETTQSGRKHYPPTNLEAVPISSTAMNLTWMTNGATEEDLFELCYQTVHLNSSNRSKCINVGDSKITIYKLKPYTLYQFKVRAVNKETNRKTPFSETIECYTNEDLPGKVEEVQWFLGNSTTVRIAWKEPNKINGLIQKYFVGYTMDMTDRTLRNVTVPGNKTSTILPGLLPGKRYFVMVQAATKAGYGKPSDPIIVITGGSASKTTTATTTTFDEQQPARTIKPEQSLGIILGVSISVGFIFLCLCSIYCRKKFENNRLLRDSTQPLKRKVTVRSTNGCCVEQSSMSVSQHMHDVTTPNEIELSILYPSSPVPTNPQPDTKGAHSNGIVECCGKEPLLSTWELNIEPKDHVAAENLQYKKLSNKIAVKYREQQSDFDGTQITIANCTLGSSDSSLNNNSTCLEEDTSPHKVPSSSIPVLGPNG